jgi:hypothetical protein
MSSTGRGAPGTQEISSPRFAAFYNWLMDRPLVRRWFDPLRREIVGRAQGVVLEVGAGGGQNFPFYCWVRKEYSCSTFDNPIVFLGSAVKRSCG